jgi:hypothetical protein
MPKLAGFGDGVMFDGRIDDDKGLRKASHLFDAFEVAEELFFLFLQNRDFLLRHLVPSPIGLHGFEIFEILDAAKDGAEVRESSAEPTMRDVEAAAAGGFVNHDLLSGRFGSHKEDFAFFIDDRLQFLVRALTQVQVLVKSMMYMPLRAP